jgi:hypothetical protein
MVVMTTDAHTLRLQQEVLNSRERALKYTLPNDVPRIDDVFFKDLREVSPGKLVPVVVKRNHDEWFVGFFVQNVGAGGIRLLICDDSWRLTRVKQSATVIRLTPKDTDEHAALVVRQRGLRKDLHQLLSRVKSCRDMRSRKASKSEAKQKNPKDNGSSPESK